MPINTGKFGDRSQRGGQRENSLQSLGFVLTGKAPPAQRGGRPGAGPPPDPTLPPTPLWVILRGRLR